MELTNIKGKWKIVITDSLPRGDRKLTLWLDVTKNTIGNFNWVEYSGDELGVKLKKGDEIVSDFDDRKFYVLLGILPLEFVDSYTNLGRMVSDLSLYKDKCYVEYEMKWNGNSVYEKLFEGYLNPRKIYYTEMNKKVKLEYHPKSNILNESPLFINGAFNNLLGYTEDNDTYIPFKTLVEDIYKLVNPNIIMQFEQDWEFRVVIGGDPPREVIGDIDDLLVRWIYLVGDYVYEGGQWVVKPNQHKTYMDLLKSMALDLGCFTGLISQDKAFFVSFDYSAGEVEIEQNNLMNDDGHIHRIEEAEIKYLKVKNQTGGISSETGTATGFSQDEIELIINDNIYSLFDGETDQHYSISYIQSPTISWLLRADFLASYWGGYYLRPETAFKNKLSFTGTTYSILNKFRVGGRIYRALKLKSNYKDEETKIEARVA